MKIKVKCNCGTKSVINTDKHKHRPKYCPWCKSIIYKDPSMLDQLKSVLNSPFQLMKKERKEVWEVLSKLIKKYLGEGK